MPLDRGERSPQVARARGGRYVEFAVADVTYAIDVIEVRRSLPDTEAAGGYAHHLGVSYPIVDLRAVFGLPRRDLPGDLLLTHTARGTGALRVDRVGRLRSIDGHHVIPLPAIYRGPERTWSAGLVADAAGVTVLVTAGPLLDLYAPGSAAGQGAT